MRLSFVLAIINAVAGVALVLMSRRPARNRDAVFIAGLVMFLFAAVLGVVARSQDQAARSSEGLNNLHLDGSQSTESFLM